MSYTYTTTLGQAYYAMYLSGKKVYDAGVEIIKIVKHPSGKYTVIYEDDSAGVDYSPNYVVIVQH